MLLLWMPLVRNWRWTFWLRGWRRWRTIRLRWRCLPLWKWWIRDVIAAERAVGLWNVSIIHSFTYLIVMIIPSQPARWMRYRRSSLLASPFPTLRFAHGLGMVQVPSANFADFCRCWTVGQCRLIFGSSQDPTRERYFAAAEVALFFALPVVPWPGP